LAAFILGQVLIGLDGIKRFLGIATSAAPDNPATEWRLGGVTTPRKSSPRLGLRWAAVVAILEIALMAGGTYGLRAHFGQPWPLQLMKSSSSSSAAMRQKGR
jgi:hypothetical protein